ncbi:bifunctional adenosylcobinamide kinase/adenosylcobinamide-phosphate guanylyltransferase [Nocardioides donggukensis]|uniref:Adenosylcobinamide kinase n=1 Tax=Nocardioides donggukensis TaxID=2774019 RepID=A0A927K4B3_9ACTN|nr:bifunctional adenosylcobinamide kinase/adenosylcobinamide-phosphate guanylyltransferase [Nocardioides donggukensis]MBD8869857.1 bifunctional adenosylcobinamide kinase/adenosylcobinamide-phosphate guanylyltransferase [Nocardioides donggukensis]
MSIHVLGTGSADGWPNPFCTCASCAAERGAGRVRAQTSVLVDSFLLDCGPETPRLAERAGVSLTGVRHVLLTHDHPDHCAPAFLLFRSWVSGDEPLDVIGPASVVAACRPWLAPDTPVRFVEVAPGDVLDLPGGTVRVVAAAHGPDDVLYDVTAPSGHVFYGTDTGPLPDVEALRDAAYDVVFLEETFGDHTGHGTAHLDLPSFAEQLRRLREVGAVTDTTDVVAVHLSHHNPPTPELARRLADWGARVVDDGTRLTAGQASAADDGDPGTVLRTLVLGGARSGKSREAERILADAEVTYVATSYPHPDDPEWVARVARHRQERPARWTTIETLDLVGLLGREGGPILVDCLTLWLTRVMDAHDAWNDDAWHRDGREAVAAEVDALLAAWRGTRRRVVAVSNEVGQGVVPDTASVRRFRDEMGRLNARLGAETEDVRWCVAGRVVRL